MRRAKLGAGLAAICSACSLAPKYQPPALPPPAAYKEAATQENADDVWLPAAPADATSRGAWWSVFGDAELNALEARLAPSNQDLKAALARYDAARAAAGVVRAEQLPSPDATAGAVRSRGSLDSPHYFPPTLGDDALLRFDLDYELDVWGRVRNAVAAGRARAQASAADLAAADLDLHAELASDYFVLRGDDVEQQLLNQSTEAYSKALDLTRRLFDGGVVPEVDVDQAETQVESTRALAAGVRLRRAQLEHAIAVLLGVPPADLMLPAGTLNLPVPVTAPGLPSTLLQRRPDVAAAERRVFAANAEIGVARAAWFPNFSITGTAGYEAGADGQTFGDWLEAPSRFWTLGAVIAQPLFEGGRLHAQSDQARASYEEAAAGYRSTVLNAYREVEDQLAALRELQQEAANEDAAVAAAQRALTQADHRYAGGATNFLPVVVAQTTALQAQQTQIGISVARLNAAVGLIRALGGGWDDGQLPAAGSQRRAVSSQNRQAVAAKFGGPGG